MAFQPGAVVYTQGFGSRPENVEVPHIENRDPSISDFMYPIGKRWLNASNETEFILYKLQVVNGLTQAVWGTSSGATSAIISLSDNTGTKVLPDVTGNIQLANGQPNQVTTTSDAVSHKINIALSNGISLGSFSGTAPPVGGLLIPGKVDIGPSTPVTPSRLQINNDNFSAHSVDTEGTIISRDISNNQYIYFENSTLAPIGNTNISAGFYCDTDFEPAGGVTIDRAASFYAFPRIVTGAGTINDCVGFLSTQGAAAGNRAIHGYGAYFLRPVTGLTTNSALYCDDACIGYPDTTPPVDGMVILGQTGIGTSLPDPSSILNLQSTSRGFLPPQMTTVQKNAIASPVAGLQVYDLTLNQMSYYNGTIWVDF